MSPPAPGAPIEISDEARLRLSDHLEQVLGHDPAGTLLRSLSHRGTAKPLTHPAVVDLVEGLEEVLGPDDTATLVAMLPLQPFLRYCAQVVT